MLAVEYVRLSRSMKSFFAKICQTFRKNLSLPMLFAVTVFGFVYINSIENSFYGTLLDKYSNYEYAIFFVPVMCGVLCVLMPPRVIKRIVVSVLGYWFVMAAYIFVTYFLSVLFDEKHYSYVGIAVFYTIFFSLFFLFPFLLTLTATFPLRKYIAKKYSKR